MLDKITVRRFTSGANATLSTISYNGIFQCFGLEDQHQDIKVPGETRVQSGIYPVKVRQEGGFHSRYSKKFSDIHQGMLHVCNVPNFTFVLIHIGNKHDDTAGCLLTGDGVMGGDALTLQRSTTAYKSFYSKVIESALAGNLIIEYIDEDR